jgi:Uma2 family endonuclease
MSTSAHKLPITAAEYLEGELHAEGRHEFMDGRIYAMSGASRKHNEICLDLASALQAHLRGGPCRTCIEAVKVRIADDIGEAYYYPDVFVACEPGDDDSHVVQNPKLIIEVLSDSTSRIDRTDKLTNYKRIPTVEEIVLIEQEWPEIVVFAAPSAGNAISTPSSKPSSGSTPSATPRRWPPSINPIPSLRT